MFSVKRLKTATISLSLALLIAGGAAVSAFSVIGNGNFSAYAEEAVITDYPAEFVKRVSEGFESISDYAVKGNVFAFAEGNVVSVIENGQTRTDHKTDSKVTALDCSDEGFFYKNGSGATFRLTDQTDATHNFQELDLAGVYVGTFNYYLGTNGVPYVSDKSGDDAPVKLDGFEKIKKYGETVYALKGGKLFKFNGLEAAEAGGEVSYTDLSAVKKVCFGETVQSLNSLNKDSLHYVTLNAGENAYVTEIDLNLLSDNPADTFLPEVLSNEDAAKRTFKIGAADGPADGKEATLLAVSGNTYVVSADGVCYIMNKANAGEPFERAFSAVSQNTVMRVAVDKACAYSSPFVCAGTKVTDLPQNATVKVLGKIESLNLYVIEYGAEGGEKTKCFTPYGYLSEYSAPIEDEPPVTTDPDYTEESPAKTVVLIVAVIALVLIALGYLTYVGTSSKRKDKKKKSKEEKSSPIEDDV